MNKKLAGVNQDSNLDLTVPNSGSYHWNIDPMQIITLQLRNAQNIPPTLPRDDQITRIDGEV